MNLYYYI